METYKTLDGKGVVRFEEKRSVFIGYAKNVEDESEAINFVKEIRTKHSDAKHNVYAYSIRKNNTIRFSDDGEPQGTAGIPVLEIIRKENLVDIAIVVTRYFGGVLLGAGGLVRAYSTAARKAVDAAGIAEVKLCRLIKITLPYSDFDKATYEMKKLQIKTDDIEYSDMVSFVAVVEMNLTTMFLDRIAEITNGRAIIDTVGDEYRKA